MPERALTLWFHLWYRLLVASGQLRVRLPVDLHEALTAEAERQGVSLNTLIVALLAGGLRFKLPQSK